MPSLPSEIENGGKSIKAKNKKEGKIDVESFIFCMRVQIKRYESNGSRTIFIDTLITLLDFCNFFNFHLF